MAAFDTASRFTGSLVSFAYFSWCAVSLKLVQTSAVVRDCELVATLACYRVTLNVNT
jgi:hypothetical protein